MGSYNSNCICIIGINANFTIIIQTFRKKQSSDYYTTGNKLYEGTHGNISPHTITSDNLSPVNTTAFNWGNKTHGNQQCVQIPKAQYSKWKRIFSRQVVEASQIEVMETIGEGTVVIVIIIVVIVIVVIIIVVVA